MFVNKLSLIKTIIKINSIIKDCAESLNHSGLQIINVVDNDKKFIGTITDGDIRRGLLNGLNLNSPIKSILNKKPIISKIDITEHEAANILKKFEIIHLPIIKDNKLAGLYFIGNAKSKEHFIENKVIIMAGGFGKRLGNLTKNTPKPMLRLNGKPLLQHIIEKLIKEGFREVYISIFYLKNKIKDYFSDGKKFGIKIKYIEEKHPMGTIGCLSLLKNKMTNSFFLINCDVITNLNFKEMLNFHKNKNSGSTIAIKNFEFINPYGVITSKHNNFKKFEEKPATIFNINAGVYVFKPYVVDIIKKNKIKSIPDLFNFLQSKNKKILTYPMYETWEDYGLNTKELKSW